MDSRNLQLVLQLQDNASKELRKVSGELDRAEKTSARWEGTLKRVKQGMLAVGAAAVAGLGFGVKVAADLETAEVGLTTLLGSAEMARNTVERLKVEAKRTPFELPGLTQATQLLTSVTKDGDKSIDILLDVGEALAAMGKGQAELDRIIVNLQQIAATGRAMTIDIRQFAFAGIPIYEMLTETTGKSGEALAELIDEGGVTFELLTKMFDEANDESGRFFNAFVNQSGTFNQALSNMKDAVGIALSDIATNTGLLDLLSASMMRAADVISNYPALFESAKDSLADFMQLVDENTLLVTHLRGAWEQIVQTFNEHLRPELEELWAALQPLAPYMEYFAMAVGVILLGALHAFIAILKVAIQILTHLLGLVTNIATFITQTLVYAFQSLTRVFQVLIHLFKGEGVLAIQAIADQFKAMWEWIKNAYDVAKDLLSVIKELGEGAIGTVMSVLPGRAVGGSVAAGQGYMVGENGPEFFRPASNGTIVPNYALPSMQAVGGVNVNVYGDVSGEELVDKVKTSLEYDIKSRTRQ